MDPLKQEFSRLVAIMGWNQSEAARQLHMSAPAVSNLLNPSHSNRPRPTTLQLLKLIVASEHPDAVGHGKYKIREKSGAMELREDYMNARERKLLADLRSLKPEDQDKVFKVIYALIPQPGLISYRKERKK